MDADFAFLLGIALAIVAVWWGNTPPPDRRTKDEWRRS